MSSDPSVLRQSDLCQETRPLPNDLMEEMKSTVEVIEIDEPFTFIK